MALSEIAEVIVEFRERYGVAWAIEDGDAWTDISPYLGTLDDEIKSRR